jgi:hypothetical protein
MSMDAKLERENEIKQRQHIQREFVRQWMLDTKGPRPTCHWKHQNRDQIQKELGMFMEEELAKFKAELDDIYARTIQDVGGDILKQMPAEEVLTAHGLTQLAVHPIPAWLEEFDAAGAFEALRCVKANGMGLSDSGSLMAFTDLVTNGHDFYSGVSFWRNAYRFWLVHYAKMIDGDFHRKIDGVVTKFIKDHLNDGFVAHYKKAPVKTYERIKEKERRFGEASHDTYAGRTMAAHCLDVIRGSITVKQPRAVCLLIERLKQLTPKENKMQVVRVTNRYSEKADALNGYRNVEINIICDLGMHPSGCGRPKHFQHLAIVGEVQIILDDFLEVKKRRHHLYKLFRGEYDWSPEDALQGANWGDDDGVEDDKHTHSGLSRLSVLEPP